MFKRTLMEAVDQPNADSQAALEDYYGQALESIDFQSGKFYAALTAVYDDLKTLPEKELRDPETGSRLAVCVRDHTGRNASEGLNTLFVLGDVSPSIEIPDVSRNNPLINDWMKPFFGNKEGLKMIQQATDGRALGGVNLKNAVVWGVFTEISATIYMPTSMIKSSKWTAAELAAITLHEVGHLFCYFEFLSRAVRTNQVLAGITRALDGSLSVKDRELVFLSAKTALGLKDFDPNELTKITDKRVIDTVIITRVIEETKSELGANVYDDNNFEYLADEFAARQGAGRELITALDKLYKQYGMNPHRGFGMYLFLEACKLLVLAGFSISLSALGGPVGVGFALVVIVSALFDGGGPSEYDRPGVRLRRLRGQIVERIKDEDLTSLQREQFGQDLKTVDLLLKDVVDRHSLFAAIGRFVVPSVRRRYNAEALQQELEGLAANELFGHANALKAMV